MAKCLEYNFAVRFLMESTMESRKHSQQIDKFRAGAGAIGAFAVARQQMNLDFVRGLDLRFLRFEHQLPQRDLALQFPVALLQAGAAHAGKMHRDP